MDMKLKNCMNIAAVFLFSYCGTEQVKTAVDNPNVVERSPLIKLFVNAEGGLRMRDKGSTSGSIITTIPNFSEIELIEEDQNNITISGKTGKWSKIRYNNIEGWVFGGFLTNFDNTLITFYPSQFEKNSDAALMESTNILLCPNNKMVGFCNNAEINGEWSRRVDNGKLTKIILTGTVKLTYQGDERPGSFGIATIYLPSYKTSGDINNLACSAFNSSDSNVDVKKGPVGIYDCARY